jgi:hypothetical protein
MRMIYREEGMLKLLFGGMGPRSAYHMIHGTVAFNLYAYIYNQMKDAYE